jgi:Tol biopolymer transport system component
VIGKTLAHYEVTSHIGAGGMGEVYRARDKTLDRDVALKILPAEFARDTERLERFAREVDEVVDVALQVARALEEAHERGIVHRDLKPANIKLAADGQVKVLDFGLAKALTPDGNMGNASLSQSPTVMSSGTIHGVVMGTAAYMSPEQARGKPIDKRTDIWAYGVILFELLAGKHLFGGDTVSDIMAGVLKTHIDLDELPQAVPPPLRQLVARCLDRDARTRLRDIGEARVLLEQPLASVTSDATSVSRRPSRRTAWLAAGLAIGAVVGVLAVRGLSPAATPTRRQPVRLEIPVRAADGAIRFALDPPGSKLAYADAGRVYVRDLDQVGEREVPESDGAILCEWSPDGEWIAYSTGTKLYKIRPDGTQKFQLCVVETGMHPRAGGLTWLADGTIVYSTGDTGLWQVSERGGSPTVLLEPTGDELDFHPVTSLPGGKGLLFVPHSPNRMNSVALYANGERSTLVEEPGELLGQAMYSDGYLIYNRARTNPGFWAVPFSLETLRVEGNPILLEPGGGPFTVSRNGHLAYSHGTAGTRRELVILDRNGNVLRTVVGATTGLSSTFSLSPDGTRVAVTLTDEDSDIWTYEVESGVRQRVAFGPELQRSPAWSPSGDQIAYIVGDMAETRLLLRDLSSSATTELPLRGARYAAFSRDGKTLVLSQNDAAMDPGIVSLTLGAAEPEPFVDTGAGEDSPALSPDGRYLAYASDASGQTEIYIQEFPEGEGKWQVSQDGGTLPYWSAAGDRLYFRNGRQFMEVKVGTAAALTLGPPRVVFESTSMINVMPTNDPDAFAAVQRIQQDARTPAIVVWMNWTASLAAR